MIKSAIAKKAIIVGLIFGIGLTSFGVQAGLFNWWKSSYTKTKYPIVLAHGLMGFNSLLGVVDYWPGIVETLEADGATVFITNVSAVNSSQVRGEQLLAQIQDIIAITGAQKVNLIGHSQGGLDIRYVATVRPDLIASITSVGGAHSTGFGSDSGSDIANIFLGGLGDLISLLSNNSNPNDANALMQTFSAAGQAQFNASYPIGLPTTPCGEGNAVENVGGYPIRVYSWGGTGIVTNVLDPTDLVVTAVSLGQSGESDGFVSRCGNHLGDVIRDNYYMNHLDLSNMMFGLVSIFETNPKSVFRTHANRLKNAGL